LLKEIRKVVAGEPNRRRPFSTHTRRSPGFPNWNQITLPTAFLLLSTSTYDKI